MTPDAITKVDFAAYERVRRSGVTNMFDVDTVAALSGLNREQILCIMQHYGALAARYSNDGGDGEAGQMSRRQQAYQRRLRKLEAEEGASNGGRHG